MSLSLPRRIQKKRPFEQLVCELCGVQGFNVMLSGKLLKNMVLDHAGSGQFVSEVGIVC